MRNKEWWNTKQRITTLNSCLAESTAKCSPLGILFPFTQRSASLSLGVVDGTGGKALRVSLTIAVEERREDLKKEQSTNQEVVHLKGLSDDVPSALNGNGWSACPSGVALARISALSFSC